MTARARVSAEVEPPERCASPFCKRSLPAGAPALVVKANWSSAPPARLCGFRCLREWAGLMAITASAYAAGELVRQGAT